MVKSKKSTSINEIMDIVVPMNDRCIGRKKTQREGVLERGQEEDNTWCLPKIIREVVIIRRLKKRRIYKF